MDIRSKKGFGLAMAIYFVILSAITSIGLYTYAMHIYKEAGIQEPRSMRGYYAALAGARYAYILLKDPAMNFGFDQVGREGFDGEFITINIGLNLNHETFKNDIRLASNETLTITIEEWSTPQGNTYTIGQGSGQVTWTDGSYRVTADFSA